MTAATYTFSLSAAQASAASMVVGLRAKTGSTIPGAASRWQGGTMPQLTLNWAANALTATGTVNTAGNSTVDGNAEYEWYKISSVPADLTLDTASLPTVTIVDDDTLGGSGNVKYSATTNSMPLTDAGGPNYRFETLLQIATAYTIRIGGDNDALPCFRIGPNGVNDTNQRGDYIAVDGTATPHNFYVNPAHDKLTTAGLPCVVTVTGTAVKVTVGSTTVFDGGLDPSKMGGNFVSFTTGGTAKPTTLTLLS